MANESTPKHVFSGVFIPAKIWLHPDFTPVEKMMLAEIKALSEDTGWCFAGNAHFAKWLKCTPQNVSNYISSFKKQAFIDVKFSDEKTHSGRKMRVNIAWYHSVPNPLSDTLAPYSPAVPPLSDTLAPLSPAVTDIHFKNTSILNLNGEGEKQKTTPTQEDFNTAVDDFIEAKKEKAPSIAGGFPKNQYDDLTDDEMSEIAKAELDYVNGIRRGYKDPTHTITTIEPGNPVTVVEGIAIEPSNPTANETTIKTGMNDAGETYIFEHTERVVIQPPPKAETVQQAHGQIAEWCDKNKESVRWCYEVGARRKQSADDLHARIVDFIGCYGNHEKPGTQLLFWSDPVQMFSKGLTKWLQRQNQFDREQSVNQFKNGTAQPEKSNLPKSIRRY